MPKNGKLPRNRHAARPYRLHDCDAGVDVTRRCYAHLHTALHGALRHIYETPSLHKLQVYNTRTAHELGLFWRSAGRIEFDRTPNGKEKP